MNYLHNFEVHNRLCSIGMDTNVASRLCNAILRHTNVPFEEGDFDSLDAFVSKRNKVIWDAIMTLPEKELLKIRTVGPVCIKWIMKARDIYGDKDHADDQEKQFDESTVKNYRIRLTDSDYEKIAALAKNNNMTISELIRDALDTYHNNNGIRFNA